MFKRQGLTPLALLALTLAVTVARTARWPNDFAEAHWLLDYRFGFVKRGFLGEAFSLLHWPFGAAPSEVTIAVGSAVLLGMVLLVLLAIAWRIVRATHGAPAALAVGTALLSSPFVVMSAHLMGYLDHAVLLLTTAALVCVTGRRLWLGVACLAGAILVHESALVYGLPVFVLAVWLAEPAWPRRFVAILTPLAAFGLIVASGSLWRSADFQDAYSRHLATFAFVRGDMHVFVPEWLSPSFAAEFARESARFATRVSSAEMFGLVLPTTLALLAFAGSAARLRLASVEGLFILGAVFAPQALHLAAWDTVRIWTYTIGSAALVVWVLARMGRFAPNPETAPALQGTAWVAVIATAANVFMTTPLYDGLSDRLTLETRLFVYTPVMLLMLRALRR